MEIQTFLDCREDEENDDWRVVRRILQGQAKKQSPGCESFSGKLRQSGEQQQEQNSLILGTTFYPKSVDVKEAAGDILQKRKMPRGLPKWMDE